jgi:NitT/TauT family transport system substrate-binding protein
MAYDFDWYNSQGEERANEILNRVLWVHLKADQWINQAKNHDSKDHYKLLTLAEEFTHRDREVVELALQNIDFDFQIDISGMKVYAQKLAQYDIFSPKRWQEGGYESPADYVNSLVNDEYITWAIENQAKSPGEISLLKVPICHPCCPPGIAKPIPIRFGYITEDLHHLAFYVAWKEGMFSKVGIEVKIAKEAGYPNGALEMTQGFKLNKVDIGYLGISPALIHGINSNNFSRDDAKIGIIAGVNYNGSAIIAQEGVNSIEDLRGKSVGFPGVGTVQHFLFLLASEDKVKVAL